MILSIDTDTDLSLEENELVNILEVRLGKGIVALLVEHLKLQLAILNSTLQTETTQRLVQEFNKASVQIQDEVLDKLNIVK